MSAYNILEWSSSGHLKWKDFEAEPHPGVYQDVMPHVGYGCTWTIHSHRKDDQLFFSIHEIELTTRFFKNLSWVRIKSATKSSLCHAQGYFDLAESMRPDIQKMLKDEFDDKLYPVRGSNEAERKQYSKQDSRVVLSVLTRLQSEVLNVEISKYQERTCYGEDDTTQKEYDRKFSILRRSSEG